MARTTCAGYTELVAYAGELETRIQHMQARTRRTPRQAELLERAVADLESIEAQLAMIEAAA